MSYNGHKSWAAWNVSLWINNDEGLYNMARRAVRQCRTKEKAARAMLEDLNACDITETPDGARYTVTSIRAAMVDL